MASTAADVSVRAKSKEAVELKRPPGGSNRWMALAFLAPALVALGAIVIYPTIDTIVQSFQNATTREFVGFENYQRLFATDRIVTAIKNNAIWVATAPAIITGLGLIFAILTERVRYATAIKIVVFMPMAISFLSTGVIWRLMYETDPSRGFVNAALGVVDDVFTETGRYPSATVPPGAQLKKTDSGAVQMNGTIEPGQTATIGLTGLAPGDLPEEAQQAAAPQAPGNGIGVLVWKDFKPGGGTIGEVEEGELGLPGTVVQVLDDSGAVLTSGETTADGSVVFEGLGNGPFTAQVAQSTFSEGFQGVTWIGEGLVTPAIIGAFSWMWAGFAVVVIGAGLAALPRDVLEAARVDGANEWQTFRHVTVPLLAPVLGVVFVTLVINVLKIFDIVFVMSAGSAVGDEANVIGVEMYKTSFTSLQYGLGSAVAVLLFVLVVPVMILNVRRFRREG